MLTGKEFQTIIYDENLTIKFFPSGQASQNGNIVFSFNVDKDSANETMNYKLINGRIVYYSNDGSKYRLELIYTTPSTWVILKEEDIDGDDAIFSFGKPTRKEYSIVNTKEAKIKNFPSVKTYDTFDQLYMDIYGRIDTRIASYIDYMDDIDNFLRVSSKLMIEKYKIEIKLREIKQHQNIYSNKSSEFTKLKDELDFIGNFHGRTLKDYDGNNLNTMEDLKDASDKAARLSMEYQRNHYETDKYRAYNLSKLRKFLELSGSVEQKKHIKELEIAGLEYDYKYFRELLNDSSIWCIADKNLAQEKPLFYPKDFIIALLHEKYLVELSHSPKTYDPDEFEKKLKELEKKSNTLKYQFIHDHLRKIQENLNKWKKRY